MRCIAVRGMGSAIAQELANMLPDDVWVVPVLRGHRMPLDAQWYLFCNGLLLGKDKPTDAETKETFDVNFNSIVDQVELLIKHNARARICVIGSESGISGSFDPAYAAAKRHLHTYVETRKLRTPEQQLVCIAPSIIGDAWMTLRRKDQANLKRRQAAHRKRRFLKAREVARLVRFVLFEDEGYLSNVVIRMNGGQHTCTN